MKKRTKLNLLIKNNKKRKNYIKKLFRKRLKRLKQEIKDDLSINNIPKALIIICLLFLILSSKFKPKLTKNYIMHEKYEKEFNKNSTCDLMDPIYIFNNRLNNKKILCENEFTKHICYKENSSYNFANKNGIICLMENIIIDPSKSKQSNYIYKGPVDYRHRGLPILSKGFFNTKCNFNNIQLNNSHVYDTYLTSWNYEYNEHDENLEELAPGKTVFLLSRNQDSPNLYHGNCEIINVISMLYLFNLLV